MRSSILTRIVCLVGAACLALGAAPGALASEEYADETILPTEELVVPEEPLPEEAPVPEPDGDPMEQRTIWLDGASGKYYYSYFTTRALDNETLHRGVDVSSWQEGINWTKAAADGVEFAIIRAAYRTYGTGKLLKDSYFAQNVRGAKAAGIKVGVYIFSQAITTAEAVEEADYLLSLVKGYDIDLPLVFDFEYVNGGRLTSKLGKRVSSDICLAFCDRVEAAGYDSMVYGNLNTFYNCLYPAEFPRLWLAHYTKKTSYVGPKYEYWQCTDSGIVNGISGPVDMDFWFEPRPEAPTPTEPPAALFPFSDVKEADWFYDSVKTAYEAEIVSGVSATAFSPNLTATRGQVTTMIYRMKGSPDHSGAAAFEDLTQAYYKTPIAWAAAQGIVSGYSETSFQPEREITREELVAILYRMAGKPEADADLTVFGDAGSIQSWATDAMRWAVTRGILSGYEDGTIRPQGKATRAEVCAILMRYNKPTGENE